MFELITKVIVPFVYVPNTEPNVIVPSDTP